MGLQPSNSNFKNLESQSYYLLKKCLKWDLNQAPLDNYLLIVVQIEILDFDPLSKNIAWNCNFFLSDNFRFQLCFATKHQG